MNLTCGNWENWRHCCRFSTTMASEGFDVEEWDADFLDQLVQAEELALSTQIPPPPSAPPPPPPPCAVSYSPPRELSQRTSETSYLGGNADYFDSFAPRVTSFPKKQEFDKLKELESVELRKERDKKKEGLEVLHSRIETKDAKFHHTKKTEKGRAASSPTFTMLQNANPSHSPLESLTKCTFNTVGVQTDEPIEEKTSAASGCWRSEKLLRLWNADDQKLGRDLVAKVFSTCEADLHVLFGYLNTPKNDSNIETAKTSHLYSVLTKISNNTSSLEELLEALNDLCSLKNVVILHRSLRVLHQILSNSFTMEKKFGRRENVIFEEPFDENTKSNSNGCGTLENESLCFANLAEMFKQGPTPPGLEFFNFKTPGQNAFFDRSFRASISREYWVSLFKNMCQIAFENSDQQIQYEAVSIMNLILIRQNAYLDRDKFAGELVFRTLSQLLRKKAGFSVQYQAVHVLYLLCNCPKVIAMICSDCKEDENHACSEDINDKNSSTFQVFHEMLTSLADCVACYGSATAEEMKLRTNAITLLAFLGSLGKSGFEILLNHRLPKGGNFLAIILQSLIPDLDFQALKSVRKSGAIKEQILLVREALILLNRLTSHPQYSIPVLKVLTNTRDMASMTVDVVHRLTQNNLLLWQDTITRKQTVSEIMDMAHAFKKKIYSFLGDSIS